MEVLFRAEWISTSYPSEENECFKFINNKWYVIGKENTINDYELGKIKLCSIVNKFGVFIGKYDTRSINFEDMLDSQENKIFASLSKEGKGGDLIVLEAFRENLQKGYCIYKNGKFSFVDDGDVSFSISDSKKLEAIIIGIKQ